MRVSVEPRTFFVDLKTRYIDQLAILSLFLLECERSTRLEQSVVSHAADSAASLPPLTIPISEPLAMRKKHPYRSASTLSICGVVFATCLLCSSCKESQTASEPDLRKAATQAIAQRQAEAGGTAVADPPTSTRPAEASGSNAISVTRVSELKKKVGQEVTVEGAVGKANKSRSGHHFLNFDNTELAVVCFKDDAAKFEQGGPSKLFAGKSVEIKGKLELFKGKLQIKLKSPDQIKVVESQAAITGGPGGGSSSPVAKVELSKIGKDTWQSPAGLRYSGRDAQGLTRVEHVLRHAEDQPRRAGSHGVFDGGKDAAFGIIDEAWLLAKKNKIEPRNEGRRSTYLISMGRRVGYLGGQTGARRNNPPLKKVFIVVETGTPNVVTAFPR